MSEMFSNERLIDYFFLIDVEFQVKQQPGVSEMIQKNPTMSSINIVDLNYRHKVLKMYPRSFYSEVDNDYSVSLDSIFLMLPQEHLYSEKHETEYFPLIFTNQKGRYYYGFFLKIYNEIEKTDQLYQDLPGLTSEMSLYSPKYLCFLSLHPFFTSFKYLLEEIYGQSSVNNSKCFKIENILSILLYRTYLPKYETTQLSFCLNEKVYTFSITPFKSEISFRLLFSYISIEHVVMLIIAIMMNSVIVLIHSNLAIIAPIINALFQLIFPFPSSYSIICNLNPNSIELMGFFGGLIVGVYRYDFNEIEAIEGENASNVVYLDIDKDRLKIDKNEYLKENKKIPIQKINHLISNLYKCADVHPKDRHKFEEMKDMDIWETFQTENIYSLEDYRTSAKLKSKKKSESCIKSSDANKKRAVTPSENNFSDIQIRCLFFDFFLQLFEGYDESKHYKINEETQDKNFDTPKFIADSKPDIQSFLSYVKDNPCFDILIQNMNHIVDQRHKKELKKVSFNYANMVIKNNPALRESSFLPKFESTYDVLLSGLEKKKAGKGLEKLFKIKIYNTITIASPPYEKLAYKQNNIFVDPIHEEIVKHESSIPFFQYKIDFTLMNLRWEDQRNLNKNLLKEELTYFKNKDSLMTTSTNAAGPKKSNLEKSHNVKDLLSIISHEILNFELTNPMTVEFKKLLFSSCDIVKKFYGELSTKTKNYLKDIQGKYRNNHIYNTTSTVENLEDPGVSQKSFNMTVNVKSRSYCSYVTSKVDYINSFNFLIKNVPFKSEFHFNFCVNLIQSVAFCDYCSKPNTIWEIRKEFIFSKTKIETKTKCKFCSQLFVPFFFVIEEAQEDNRKNLIKKGINNSFVEYINDSNPEAEVKNDLISSKNTLDSTKILRRVEYMCLEHIMSAYQLCENDAKSNRVKKFPYSLYYNACLLLGDIKVIRDTEFHFDTLDSYVQRYLQQHPNSNDISIPLSPPSFNSNRNSLDLLKILREGHIKTEKTPSKKKEAHKKKENEDDQIKILKIQFDLRDLMNDKKYEEFQRDLNGLPKFHQVNVRKYQQKRDMGLHGYQRLLNAKSSRRNLSRSCKKFDIKFVKKSMNDLLKKPKMKTKSRSKSKSLSKIYPTDINKNQLTCSKNEEEESQYFIASMKSDDYIIDRGTALNFLGENTNTKKKDEPVIGKTLVRSQTTQEGYAKQFKRHDTNFLKIYNDLSKEPSLKCSRTLKEHEKKIFSRRSTLL